MPRKIEIGADKQSAVRALVTENNARENLLESGYRQKFDAPIRVWEFHLAPTTLQAHALMRVGMGGTLNTIDMLRKQFQDASEKEWAAKHVEEVAAKTEIPKWAEAPERRLQRVGMN